MKNCKFSVIVASFNGEKYLEDCLSSVFKTKFSDFEVVVVDDGSSDKSLEIIKKFGKKNKLKLIQNDRNIGLVLSRNKAIEAAKGEILVFLDNDTMVDKSWLNGLKEAFLQDNKIGAAQCKIFDFKKKSVIQEIGMKLVPFTGFGVPLGRGEKDQGQYNKFEQIIALGAALAVKKEIAKKIGGFDSKLFHYTDDLDFSWRVWIAGYRIVLAPNAKIYHHTKIHQPNYKLYYHLSKNSLRMILKNYEFLNVIKFFPIALFFNIIGVIYVLISRGSWDGVFGFVLGFFWNIVNWGNTLSERLLTQGLRKTKDSVILPKIMVPSDIFSIYKLYFSTAKKTDKLIKSSS